MLPKLFAVLFLLFSFIVFTVSDSNDECICPQENIKILCNDTTVINGTYCDNFKCTYNLIPELQNNCPTTHYVIMIGVGLRPSIDYLIFKNNGKRIQNFTKDSEITTNFYFTSQNNFSLEFHSGIPLIPTKPTDNWFWFVTIKPMQSPIFNSVILNNISSKHVVWLPDMIKNDALIVCTNEKSKTLKMFSSYTQFGGLTNFALYDDQNLNNFIQTLGDISITTILPNAQSAESSSGCFTLYASETFDPSHIGNTVLFTAENDDSAKNCQGENNVFQMVVDEIGEFDVSIKSSDKGACEMVILAVTDIGTDLPHIWIRNFTTSSKDGQYIFKSVLNDKTLLNLKASEVSQWKYVGFYTPVLSISSSQSAEISMHFSPRDQEQKWVNVDSGNPQKGIITSPSYCGFMRKFNTFQLYYSTSFSHEKSINFVIKDIYGTPNIILGNDGKNQVLNSNFTATVTYNFSINYAEVNPTNNGFLIEYTIKNPNLEKTTTGYNNSLQIKFEFYALILSTLFLISWRSEI